MSVLYKDIDLRFLPNDVGDVSTMTDRDSIIQSMKTLILTNVYERVMHPEKGSQLSGLLFENDSPETRMALRDAIISVLSQYEPRIIVNRVNVAMTARGDYDVSIEFSIIDFNEVKTVDLILTRVR